MKDLLYFVILISGSASKTELMGDDLWPKEVCIVRFQIQKKINVLDLIMYKMFVEYVEIYFLSGERHSKWIKYVCIFASDSKFYWMTFSLNWITVVYNICYQIICFPLVEIIS